MKRHDRYIYIYIYKLRVENGCKQRMSELLELFPNDHTLIIYILLQARIHVNGRYFYAQSVFPCINDHMVSHLLFIFFFYFSACLLRLSQSFLFPPHFILLFGYFYSL